MDKQRRRARILRRDDSFTATIDTGAPNSSFMLRSVPDEIVTTEEGQAVVVPETASEPAGKPARKRQRAPRGKGEKASSELIKLNFTVPVELAERAEKMAVKARCPARRIAINALNELKPELLAAFSSIRHSEIDRERQSNAGMRVSTTWAVSKEVMTGLEKELDPMRVGQVNSLISAWVRDRFTRHFDGYLAAAGY